MHISEHMLQGALCPVNFGLGLLGITAAAVAATKISQKPHLSRLVGVTALIFSGQMFHLPVVSGILGMAWLLVSQQHQPQRQQLARPL